MHRFPMGYWLQEGERIVKRVGVIVAIAMWLLGTTALADLVGFGKSDKYVDEDAYSYAMQVDYKQKLIEALKLKNVTFFGQDWGGLIGLRAVAADPERFARVVVSNTGLPAARSTELDTLFTV